MNNCTLYVHVDALEFISQQFLSHNDEINMGNGQKNTILLTPEDEFRLLAENMTDLIAIYSAQGVLEYISPSIKNLLGYEPSQLVGIRPTKYIHPDDIEKIEQSYHDKTYDKADFFVSEYRLLHKNGKWVHFSTQRRPLRNKAGKIEQVIATCHDITDRIEAEEARKQNEKYYRLLADNILDMVAVHATNGIFEYVSPSSINVLGYSPEELIGLNAFSFVHPEEADALYINNRNQAAEGRDTFINEFRIRHKEGHYIFFETTTKIIRNENGEAINFLTTSRDITQWKLDQFALKESEEKYRSLIE